MANKNGKSWECHYCLIELKVTIAGEVEFSHLSLYLKYIFPLHTAPMKYLV